MMGGRDLLPEAPALTGATAEERLAEIEGLIAAGEQHKAMLATDLEPAIYRGLRGEPGAREEVARIKREIAETVDRLADLRRAKAAAEAEIAAERHAVLTAGTMARRRRIADERERLFGLVQKFDGTAAAFASDFKEILAAATQLGADSDSQQLKRWNQTAPTQVRNGIAALFDIDSAAAGRPNNNLLNLVSTWQGERAHYTVRQFFEEILDTEAPLFATEEAAGACRARLALRRMAAIIVPLDGGLFLVVPESQVFVDRASAEGAMRSVSMYRNGYGLAGFGGGWLILPQGLADAVLQQGVAA